MSLSNFLTDPHAALVADASVVINLNATLRAADILRALPNRFVVTDNACAELEAGVRNGHDDAKQLQALMRTGLAHRVPLGTAGAVVYETLIDGSTLRTLDDGEAATIGYAIEVSGIALIDERKARTLCTEYFAGVTVVSTVDLLMHDLIAQALGVKGQAQALMSALTGARMRVPPEHVLKVKAMIGAEQAKACLSLPKAARA